jgi:ribose/xylose/arabinose/galactoside ABC-type transport system permease subunit
MDDSGPDRDCGGVHLHRQTQAGGVSTTASTSPRFREHGAEAFIERNGLFVFCVVLTVGAALFAPGFRSPNNLQNVLTNAAPLGVVVLGQCLVILVRGFDLSVASVMATAAVIATSFDETTNWSVIPILTVSLLMAVIVGSVNGYLVTQREVSPFLATLAMMIVLQGLRFAWTKGAASGRVPEMIRMLGSQAIYGIPINLLLLLVLSVIVGVMLQRTAFGRKIYMVGGNPRAAELVGINVNRVTFACYVLSSILAALGGLVLVGYVGSVDNWVGRGYELNSIIATVMGGVSLGGGRGTVLGALVGAFVLTEIFNITLLLGFPVQFQWVVKGVVILLAVAVYLAAYRSR